MQVKFVKEICKIYIAWKTAFGHTIFLGAKFIWAILYTLKYYLYVFGVNRMFENTFDSILKSQP